MSAQAASSRSIGERVVERIHEHAPHEGDHQHARAVLGVDEGRAAAGGADGIVERPDQPRRPLDEDQRLALVEGVVAERDGVGTGVDQLVVDRLGDAEAAGRVLAVDGDEIELPVAPEPRQPLQHRRAPAAADDVADEEDAHAVFRDPGSR